MVKEIYVVILLVQIKREGDFMSVKFCTIASGSSGNSTFVGTEYTKILIDAGLSGKRITESLSSLQVMGNDIDALFITHEHIDHIKGAGVLSRKFDIPIYATQGTWEAMENQIGKIAPKNTRFVYTEEQCVINDICLQPFSIPHDAKEPVGYSIATENHKITLATDLGHITEEIRKQLVDSEILLLEANHDEELVKSGCYPLALKQRILGEQGHISNRTAGKLLCEIMSEKLKYVFLGHLSDENNHPHLAYETVEKILKKDKIKVGSYLHLDMASRYSRSRVVEL